MSSRQRFNITLTLAAPLLSHGSGALGYGLDAASRRDRDGRPGLPGTLVKGNLLHAWRQLQRITGSPSDQTINAWLGQPSPPGSNDAPERGRLRFSRDWSDPHWRPERAAGGGRRFRIQIDAATGAVADGALQVIDSPWPAGAELKLRGHIDALDLADAELDELQRLLHKGLLLVPAFGALKGSGFGRLLGVSIERQRLAPARGSSAAPMLPANATSIGLRLRPSGPFCFARPAIGAGNHFEAEAHIPGGAIKAALARRIDAAPGRWPLLQQQLSALHLRHALPVVAGEQLRPLVVPLSLVAAAGSFHDIATLARPGLINGDAPQFSIDWKDAKRQAAASLYNPRPAHPQRLLDIRTSIDADSGSAAAGELFSMESIDPCGCDWLGRLDVSAALKDAERLQLWRELADVAADGLSHLGKTKAAASLSLEAAPDYSRPQQPLQGDTVVLHLQTPARLLPAELAVAGSNDGAALHRAYAAAWRELSAGSLGLLRFYASQRLLGGSYWHSRFRGSSGRYQPQLFTRPGSVFVLTIIDSDAASHALRRWQRLGLPQLADAPGAEDWQANPWIAANGYGEIALNIHPVNGGAA